MPRTPAPYPRTALLLFITALCLTGCQRPIDAGFEHPGPGLAVWPNAAVEQTLETIYARDNAVHGWRAQGVLTIEEPDSRARLDVIVLADRLETQTPRLRLRATKLGRTVMDVVFTEGEAWLWVRGGEQPDMPPNQSFPPRLPPMRLQQFELLLERTLPDYFVFRAADPGVVAGEAEVWVHRPTRTMHRVRFDSPEGPTTLTLRYRPDDAAPVLDAFRLTTPEGQALLLQVHAIEINPAFTPIQFEPMPGSRLLTD